MLAPLTHPTWDQVSTMCSRLALDITRCNNPSLVVGLSRGGLVPGVIISHQMSIPFTSVEFSSNSGQGETASGDIGDLHTQVDQITKQYQKHQMQTHHQQQVVIVDDIVDSGHTMLRVAEAFDSRGWKPITAALYYKTTAVFTPKVCRQHIGSDSPWIVFPWEL